MKKLFTFLLALMLAFSIVIVEPVGKSEVMAASGNSIPNAINYSFGSTINGKFAQNAQEVYFYKFYMPVSGSIRLTGTGYLESIYMFIYDEKSNSLWDAYPSWNANTEQIPVDETFWLNAGTYYFSVKLKYNGWNSNIPCYGSWNFKINYTSSNESFVEKQGGNNNSLATANAINLNKKYIGCISLNDSKDSYKFTTSKSGKVNVQINAYKNRNIGWELYNEKGECLHSRTEEYNNVTENIVVNTDLYISAGTYYLVFIDRSYWVGVSTRCKYDFILNYTSSEETFIEKTGGINNTLATASGISVGSSIKGQLSIDDNKDFYRFSLTAKQAVRIGLDGNFSNNNVSMALYDYQGNTIYSEEAIKNYQTNKITYRKAIKLNAGTYYIAVLENEYYGTKYPGFYSLNLLKLTQSNCPHDYDTKTYYGTYFERGYDLHCCSICGKKYKNNFTAKQKLNKPYFYTGLVVGGKKSIKASWSEIQEASGYQLQYSRKGNMKGAKTITIKGKNKTTKTIKKLQKRKKYYVRVRAYKKKGKKMAYSAWSDKKKAKTK